MKESDISELNGLKILSIETDKNRGPLFDENCPIDEIVFKTDSGNFKMYHDQECCEYVRLYDVAGGELSDLVGETVVAAYSSSNIEKTKHDGAHTWTFYTIRTNAVTLTLRWLGESIGHYSEEVTFIKHND